MSLDDRVRAALDQRAGTVAGPITPDLGDRAVAAGRRVRRRRRVAMGAAAVVVAAAVAAPFLARGSGSDANRIVAPGPTAPPTTSPPAGQRGLPAGAPPETDVIVGRRLLSFATGSPRVVATLPAPPVAAVRTVAGDVVTGPGYTVLVAPSGRMTPLGLAGYAPAVSPGGTLAAVVARRVGAHDAEYELLQMRDGAVIATVTARLGRIAGMSGDLVVINASASDGPLVWNTSIGGVLEFSPQYGDALSVRAGVAALLTRGTPTCVVTVQLSDTRALGRNCDLGPATLSPDGTRLIAADPYAEGEPDVADVAHLRVDQVLVRVAERADLGFETGSAVWVDNRTVLVAAERGSEDSGFERLVVRCGVDDGRCVTAYDAGRAAADAASVGIVLVALP